MAARRHPNEPRPERPGFVHGYVRVSTDEQARSGLGLDAQRRAIAAARDVDEWVSDDGFSAKDLNRPGIAALLPRLEEGDVLVVARLDRLTRSLVDAATLMEAARDGGWSLVALDLGVDMTTAAGRLVANVMCAVAQWEREVIGERTKAALAEARARGVRLGGPRYVDGELATRIRRLRGRGWTFARIANHLTAEGVPTTRGGARWHASTVRAVAIRP